MSMRSVRVVLWDADGVVQSTPAPLWELAVRVVEQVPGALIGAAIDEQVIHRIAGELGLGGRTDDILSVWSSFELSPPVLEIVALVRAGGRRCYLATNQDAHRASRMRELPAYREVFDGAFYSCDLGVAKPSVAYFERVVADLDLEPGDVLFIDDRPGNIVGARSAGLHAQRWTHDDGIPELREILHAHGVPLR